MLAQLKAGTDPGTPRYVEEDCFISNMTTLAPNGSPVIKSAEAAEWAHGGRVGSRFQLDEYLYVKVKKEGDDPFQYYTPPEPQQCEKKSLPDWHDWGYAPKKKDCSKGCSEEDGSCNTKKSGGCGGCSGKCP